MVNSIVWGNMDGGSGAQIYDDIDSYSEVTYTLVQGGYTGTGNISLDPLFVAPITATAAPTATGNYRLRPGSPAIDAGTNVSVTVATDLDGNPRIVGGVVDMGAYEAGQAPEHQVFLPLVLRN